MSFTMGDDAALDAELEGRRAFRVGKKKSDNPYKGKLALYWENGFKSEEMALDN